VDRLLLGLAAAFAAAACYSVGVSFQALEARRVGLEHALRLSLLRRLVRRPRWLLGISIDGCGWGLQAVALSLAPLTVVQPVLAAGLVFLLAIGVVAMGERVGSVEIAAVVAIAVGVAGIGWAAPAHSTDHASLGPLLVAFALLGAVALVPPALGRRSGSAGVLIAAGAGVAFACDALAMKLMTDDLARRAWLGLAVWLAAMAAFAGLGTLNEMSAMQACPVIQVAPIVFMLDTLVPITLAPVLGGETWKTIPALAVSVAAVLTGGIVLARSRAVGSLLAEATRAESETARRPLAETSAIS
jgi:drug/metabolite transporter (DMT)-like permease